MPALLIHNAGGAWEALIENTNTALAFEGATEAEQLESVKQLAAAMRSGWESVTEVILDVFQGAPEGADGAVVAEDVFATTSELIYEGFGLFQAAEGETLASVIEEVGAALLAVL